MKQKNDIALSVIIPVYNVERYLKDCLDSVVSYNRDDIEIVAVNDGSTDHSLSILEKYSLDFKNIKICNQENHGLSAARNSGIKMATGEYLLFLDSDDFLIPGVLNEIITNIANRQENDFFLGRAFKCLNREDTKELCQVDYNKIVLSSPSQFFLDLHKISSFWFAAWLLIIKREFLISNSLYFKTGIYHEDELWVPSVFVKAKSMGLLNFGFYCYRTNREGSIVTSPKIKREFDKLLVVDELNSLKGYGDVPDKLIKDRQASIIFGILLSLHKFKDNSAYSDLIELLYKHLHMLKYEKYFGAYLATSVLGIKNTSSLINYFIK